MPLPPVPPPSPSAPDRTPAPPPPLAHSLPPARSHRLIYLFGALGFFPSYPAEALLPYVLGVALAATVVESLPINQVLDDNLSVPLVALMLGIALCPALPA
jgi:hypothetical protein